MDTTNSPNKDLKLIDFSEYRLGKKVIKAKGKNKGKVPECLSLFLKANYANWEEFEFYISDDRFVGSLKGKVILVTSLLAIIESISRDDPELQAMAIETLEDLIGTYTLSDDTD